MLEADIIKPSISPYNAPILLVRKGEKVRLCLDYRELNKVTKFQTFPLPTSQELFDRMHNVNYFSCLDFFSGFNQMSLSSDSCEKTAFSTSGNHYEFNVLPFGVKNGVSGFNRVLNHILRDKLWKSCLAYVDDVLVMSSTFEEHVQRLHEIFDTLEKANLTLKLAKCSFFQKSVKYLGHILSKSGLSPSPALISPIMDWPVPTNAKLVQKFLGLSAYYRTFIRNFSEIAKPLYHLTNKDEKFLWTDECQQSFDKPK